MLFQRPIFLYFQQKLIGLYIFRRLEAVLCKLAVEVLKKIPNTSKDNLIIISCKDDMRRGREGRKLKDAGFAVFVCLMWKCKRKSILPFFCFIHPNPNHLIAFLMPRFEPGLILDSIFVQSIDRDKDLAVGSRYRFK